MDNAVKRLQVPREYFSTDVQLRQWQRADWRGVHTDVMAFAGYMLKALKTQGIPAFVHCAFRTHEEQMAIFHRGNSRATAGSSPHNWGLAVDIVHTRFPWQMTKQEWAFFGHVGKQVADRLGVKMEWGGDWKFYDPAHWQIGRGNNWPAYSHRTPQQIEALEPVRMNAGDLMQKEGVERARLKAAKARG